MPPRSMDRVFFAGSGPIRSGDRHFSAAGRD